MKLRIKDHSLRFRLTRSEVLQLSQTGIVEATTPFPQIEFRYAVQVVTDRKGLDARISPYSIEMLAPPDFISEWPYNKEVGLRSTISLPNGQELKLLLEKDFVCLDDTDEDQSDQYDNPNAKCMPASTQQE